MAEQTPADSPVSPGSVLLTTAREVRMLDDAEIAAREILDDLAGTYLAYRGTVAPDDLLRRMTAAGARVTEIVERRRLLVEELARIRARCPQA